jgi:hypothetical protein
VEILRQAANIFPSGNVPVDFDERTEVFESLPEEKVEDELSALDDQWYAGDDEFLPTLARYVHNHGRSSFAEAATPLPPMMPQMGSG